MVSVRTARMPPPPTAREAPGRDAVPPRQERAVHQAPCRTLIGKAMNWLYCLMRRVMRTGSDISAASSFRNSVMLRGRATNGCTY